MHFSTLSWNASHLISIFPTRILRNIILFFINVLKNISSLPFLMHNCQVDRQTSTSRDISWFHLASPKRLSRSKRVCLKQVSCFTTMYVIKRWRREETFGIPHVSSLLHHFTTYIVVKDETRFKHTRFELDKPLSYVMLDFFSPMFLLQFIIL